MAEIITLTAAIDPPKTVFRPSYVGFDLLNQRIDLQLRDWNGTAFGERMIIVTWTDAMTTLRAINKANLTTRSLLERLMDKAITEGKVPSATTGGTPD